MCVLEAVQDWRACLCFPQNRNSREWPLKRGTASLEESTELMRTEPRKLPGREQDSNLSLSCFPVRPVMPSVHSYDQFKSTLLIRVKVIELLAKGGSCTFLNRINSEKTASHTANRAADAEGDGSEMMVRKTSTHHGDEAPKRVLFVIR